MTSDEQDIERLFSKVQTYLRQQKELYGELFIRPQSTDPVMPKPEEQKKVVTGDSPSGQQHSAPSEQVNLFGEPEPVATKSSAGAPSRPVLPAFPNEPWVQATTLVQLDSMINTCVKCTLGHTRTNFVFEIGRASCRERV